VANDFAGFFTLHPTLRAILFNGAAAEATFLRQVPASVVPAGVRLARLPSTSPANRAIATDDKACAWGAALQEAGVRLRPAPSV
jgi:G:T/U-mismatch repair DNA glycosylase